MTQDTNGSDKVVYPPRFRASRVSDLRRYFTQDTLFIKCQQDIQGAVARSIDEVGINSVEAILKGVHGYLEMLKIHGST